GVKELETAAQRARRSAAPGDATRPRGSDPGRSDTEYARPGRSHPDTVRTHSGQPVRPGWPRYPDEPGDSEPVRPDESEPGHPDHAHSAVDAGRPGDTHYPGPVLAAGDSGQPWQAGHAGHPGDPGAGTNPGTVTGQPG